jgi:hypothetical protein
MCCVLFCCVVMCCVLLCCVLLCCVFVVFCFVMFCCVVLCCVHLVVTPLYFFVTSVCKITSLSNASYLHKTKADSRLASQHASNIIEYQVFALPCSLDHTVSKLDAVRILKSMLFK